MFFISKQVNLCSAENYEEETPPHLHTHCKKVPINNITSWLFTSTSKILYPKGREIDHITTKILKFVAAFYLENMFLHIYLFLFNQHKLKLMVLYIDQHFST